MNTFGGECRGLDAVVHHVSGGMKVQCTSTEMSSCLDVWQKRYSQHGQADRASYTHYMNNTQLLFVAILILYASLLAILLIQSMLF